MRYLSRTGVQKNIASMLLSVLCFETVLPAHAWAVAATKESRAHYTRSHTPAILHAANTNVQADAFSTTPFSPTGFVPNTPEKINTIKKRSEQPFIGGPGQPEMSSFKSVNADNMVDLFTGDFSYNIPLLDVGGYPVNIHYNGGPTIDQEASWVGLGWNVNPGTVNRSMRGLPDDYNGEDKIKRIQKIKDNKTVGVGVGGNLEIFGGVLNLNINLGVFNNSYNGWGLEYGVNANISAGKDTKGPLTASLGLHNNSQSGLNVTPGLSMNLASQASSFNGTTSVSTNYNSRSGLSGLQFNTQIGATINASGTRNKINYYSSEKIGSLNVHSSFISFATPAYSPTIQMPFTSTNFTFSAKYGGELWGAFTNFNISGYVSKQEIADVDTLQSLPGYGFLYYTNGKNDAHALLDMNREKEIYFNQKSTPHVAVPQYTYDIYSISGEGTGGMFRPYRSEAGYVRDHQMQTKSNTDNFAINLGGGGYLKAGIDYNETIATTRNSAWKSDVTSNLDFQNADTTFQPVYFRNPGEKTSNSFSYYHAVGGDSTVRVKLSGSPENIKAENKLVAYANNKPDREISISGPLLKQQRDKRTQVITYKTANEALLHGLDKKIQDIKENSIPIGACPDTTSVSRDRTDEIRKGHHISEVTVLNADGRRYIYGLPAYNVEQQDVTFAINRETEQVKVDRGIADYEAEKDNHARTNTKGKDNFFTKDIMPPYAHSFLLTGLVSPDYVDITEDGITDDDLGDAVKFNYTMVYGKVPGKNLYRWRTPNEQNKVNYNEGLKTYSRDDKGTYMYGEKEVWYLNSVASKTMIAVFRISDKREDGLGITDENGGVDPAQKLRRLDRIDLYSKPDLVKNGLNAKPVKSVHFEYDYSLCRNAINNSGNPVDKNGNTVSVGSSTNVNKNKGKLTLRRVWFSYNGNYKGVKNPYVFNYGQVTEEQTVDKYNPEHNSKHYDRWGGYKHPSSNPSGLNNGDYPYAVQDSIKAAEYANAWNLTDIKLPSGGLMKISYEADDYGYVQNKRAMQLFKVAGFGNSPGASPVTVMYDGPQKNITENEYIFIDVSEPVYEKSDIYRRYLEGVTKLFCKIAVEMPSDRWGGGVEYIPTWLEIDQNNYGIVTGNTKRIWIKLAKVDGKHPLILAALQFMKLNIPSKAYPSSEMGDNLTFSNLVTMLASALPEIRSTLEGFYEFGKSNTWCKKTLPSASFVRLNSPLFKKYGGGYRVKRVEVFDNWKTMTNQREASYGQNYFYTTTKIVTKDTVISGVRKLKRDTLNISSGVASYEPFIGGEENPLREPIEYEEKLSVLAPKHYMYSEKPLGESFFPAAMVGYSKVRVRTIHTKAKSANGWQETEFFTTKDFPTRVEFTSLDGASKKNHNPKLRNLLKLNAVRNLTISQGFKVELNDMNGKMKGQANYAENDPDNPIHYTKNFYKVDNLTAPAQHLNNTVWVVDSLNGSVNTNGVIGMDIEMMNDMREQYSITYSKNHQANLDLIPFLWFALPIITYFPMFQKEENTFRSVATVKIVQRYGILDSVAVVDKGSVVTTKNLVYDAETGDPVVSRTNNEFDDPVYQFNYPAHWAYSGMGPAYKNIDAIFSDKKVINGKMYNRDESLFDAKRFFESGDEILVKRGTILPLVIPRSGNCPFYLFVFPVFNKKIWAIDAAKGKEKDKGIYFIDENGKAFHGTIAEMQIIRSGKRNMLGTGAGNVVSLANPVKEISTDRYKIVIDSNLNIINTSATAYKDLWQVEKSYYVKDSVVRVYKDFPSITAQAKVHVVRYDTDERSEIFYNYPYAISSFDFIRKRSTCHHSRTVFSKSILDFDLSQIPTDAIITSAYLSFTPKVPYKLWGQVSRRGPLHCERDRSYDWAAATTFHKDYSAATIRRISGEWSNNTHYNNFVTVSNVNSINVTSSLYNNISATGLIQEYIQNPRRGLVFQLNKNTYGDINASESSCLSFCGRNESNLEQHYCPDIEDFKLFSIGGCSCSAPTVVVDYKAYVDSAIKLCKENISDTATNPYRWGILGNWRADRAYTWYSDRKENDAATTGTNIRVEGTLKQWTPYWQFSDSGLVVVADTTKWVWNAASSIYNKRGFEIENYDPLGRYNAGLYGYNQSLPVAVIQNSRYREVLFDGFEDYNFRNQACIPLCENPREFDFVKGQSGVSIDSNQSHTGNYSVKINAAATAILTAAVSKIDSVPYALSALVDSVPVYNTKVIGSDTTRGLTAVYTLCSATPRYDAGINFQWGYAPPVFEAGCPVNRYNVAWSGMVQPRYTGYYTFRFRYGGRGAIVTIAGASTVDFTGNAVVTTSVPLTAGQLYPVMIYYVNNPNQSSYASLQWSSDMQAEEVIPGRFLYMQGVTSAPAASIVQSISHYCISLNNIKADSIIRPIFKPVQGKKIVISAWVRRDGADCDTGPSPGNVLSVAFKQGGTPISDSALNPTGVRIETWQRYERIITVPGNATQIQLNLKGLAGQAIYVDDIRVQPYNSSMKSFAYDAVSLRLMAELDENNYASFYEYDNDGTLIRVKKETVKGIQTIKETRSALIRE